MNINNALLIRDDVLSIVKMDPSMAFDVWQNSLDDNNRRFVPDEVFETLEDAQEVVAQIVESYKSIDGPFIYAVIRNSDSKNLGYVQLVKIDDGFEIGYHIAMPYCGNGYATRAVKLFLEYLKEDTKLKEVYGIALADNYASRKVLEKNGFELFFEGSGLYQGNTKEIVKAIKKIK